MRRDIVLSGTEASCISSTTYNSKIAVQTSISVPLQKASLLLVDGLLLLDCTVLADTHNHYTGRARYRSTFAFATHFQWDEQ